VNLGRPSALRASRPNHALAVSCDVLDHLISDVARRATHPANMRLDLRGRVDRDGLCRAEARLEGLELQLRLAKLLQLSL
jgi:hypothetical protein